MNNVKSNMRRLALSALGALLAANVATASDTAKSSDVTVQAERPTATVVGRDATGAPVVFVEVRHRVSYSDLDLAIPSNAKVLKTRVRDAARGACKDIDTLYPMTAGNDGCALRAEERAMPQVLSAIAAAEARKTAAD